MKPTAGHLIAAGMLLAAAATGLRAQNRAGTNYLTGSVGASFVPDVTIKNSGGLIATFNPGARATFSFGHDISDSFLAGFLGYDVSERFAVEFESGLIWNSMDKIGGISLSSGGTCIDLYQVPVLANLLCKQETDDGLSTYIGAGVGGIASALTIRDPNVGGNDADFTFAYQAMVGVSYALNDRMSIGLSYKFLGTLDHSWAIQGKKFDTEPVFTHSVLAVFTWKL